MTKLSQSRKRRSPASRWKRAVLALVLSGFAATAAAESYSYDVAGRLVRVVYPDNSSISYQYDLNGNLLSTTTTAPGARGDADLDGDVDDDDVAAILALVLDGGEPFSPTADCNGDDRVSVADLACTVAAKDEP